MKKILLFFLLIVSISHIYAQKDKDSNPILAEFEEMKSNFSENKDEWVFSRIVNLEGTTKDDIYTKSLEILAKAYKDSKEVIQMKDKDAGIIIGKGLFESDIRTISNFTITRNQCYHIIKIETKDDRCRISITINTILVDSGSDLRRPFNGTEYNISNFYPYWENCKPKQRKSSFENLKFVYDKSLSTLDYIEKELKKTDDQW